MHTSSHVISTNESREKWHTRPCLLAPCAQLAFSTPVQFEIPFVKSGVTHDGLGPCLVNQLSRQPPHTCPQSSHSQVRLSSQVILGIAEVGRLSRIVSIVASLSRPLRNAKVGKTVPPAYGTVLLNGLGGEEVEGHIVPFF